jgi:hypothetical protein
MNPPPALDPPPVPVVSLSVVVVPFVDVVPKESDSTLLDRIDSGASVAGAVTVCEQPARTASAATRITGRHTIVLLLSFQ